MLPLILTLSSILLLMLNILKNYTLSKPVLLNFRSIKLIKLLTDEEKLLYIDSYYNEYLNVLKLNNKFLTKDFCIDDFIKIIKIENDSEIIKDSLIKYMDQYSEIILNDQQIENILSNIIKLNEKFSYLINKEALINEIKLKNLKGHNEIIEYLCIRIPEMADELMNKKNSFLNSKDLFSYFSKYIPSIETMLKVGLVIIVLGTVSYISYTFFFSQLG
jgi:hypothetical protein